MFCPQCGLAITGGHRFCPGCRAELPDFPLSAGTRLDKDRYEILALLKKGGMGAVYRALDHRLEKTVALKQLLPGADEGYFKERFQAEGNWLSRLSHPALPRVTDNFSDRDCFFLAMDLIPGEDLESYLEANGPLATERVVKVAHQLLDVLEFLHTSDPPVVYRDLKPANIILGPDDRVTLVDFGLATAPAAATGTAIGTEGYCPLEQYQGKAEPRSDLYALGATMLCLLTGVAPTPLQYPGAPALDSVLRKAMALQLEDRYADASAFRRALAGDESLVAVAADGAEMVSIAGGTFRLGRSDDPDYSRPREVQLESFWVDRLPVSNGRFRAFVEATRYRVEGSWPEWKGDQADYPAVGLSWNDARAYCAWAGKRLPTEDEWERAATGPEPRKYPFGDEWDPAACQHGTSRDVPMLDLVNGRGPSPVGHYPAGASPEGCLDMAGNVWEWTTTAEGPGRVVKGGCWANRDPRTLACAARLLFAPESHDARRGFRGVSTTRPT